MFTYPQLSPIEQADLPQLLALPTPIPNKFEDSTHQLFYCQTADGEMVLKICNSATIATSFFWQGTNLLFAADFPKSLGNMHVKYHFLASTGTLNIPELIASSANRFVLSRFLAGSDVAAAMITDQSVIALAEHITRLHQCTYTRWGRLEAPEFSAKAWAGRLQEVLVFLVNQHDMLMRDPLVIQTLAQTKNIHETQFVPIMLDLRWDQFRHTHTNQLALIDLDAFVIAPRTLDLILLEYVLTPAQWALFKQHYSQTHSWPNLAAQKPCYQLLLFLMNVLGERDLAKWMQRI